MGKLEKLTIQAYKDPKFIQKEGDAFGVMINPEKYSRNFSIEYNEQQPTGTSRGGPVYIKSRPESIKLEFIFDGTGAIPNPVGGQVKSVDTWLEEFKEIVYDYNGEIHSINYLVLSWGSLVFKCRLEQYSVEYNLFKEDGTPLRAKVSADFKEFTDPETASKESAKSSPDLSHVHVFTAGDSLPYLCFKIYDDPSLFLEVARANDLTSPRKIAPGTEIYFPPIKK
ncbi:MAG: LysM peptidoglycan-binding domain-containing protein [Bacteroidota bacterium]